MVASFLLLSIAVVAALSIVAFLRVRDTLEKTAFERLEVASNFKEVELNVFVENQLGNIMRIADTLAIRNAAETMLTHDEGTETYRIAKGTLGQLVQFASAVAPDLDEILFLTDVGGRIFYSTDKAHEGEFRVTDFYFTQGRVEPVIQNVYPSPVIFAPTLTVAVPLISNTGQQLGVVAAHISLATLDRILNERTGLGITGESYLVDAYNVLVSGKSFGTTQYPRGVHSEGIDGAVSGERGSEYIRITKTCQSLAATAGSPRGNWPCSVRSTYLRL